MWDEITYPFSNFNGCTNHQWGPQEPIYMHFQQICFLYTCHENPFKGWIFKSHSVQNYNATPYIPFEKHGSWPVLCINHPTFVLLPLYICGICCIISVDSYSVHYMYCLCTSYDGFVKETHNSSVLAMELHLFCTNPSILNCLKENWLCINIPHCLP